MNVHNKRKDDIDVFDITNNKYTLFIIFYKKVKKKPNTMSLPS